VPQGAIIAAVLETALDSTRPGAARAIVSRDVRSFDGSRVLIPRGSRLYGEYAADVSSGQNRALITWSRLTRPDAVIIKLDSPSADPLGREGVRGKVDSHFFARFGSAILQSVLDIGVGLATRSVSDNAVIVALPGSSQQVTAPQQNQVQPTLRIQQGTSVSVFVSRDLDFSTVE
jgi:type IV secretion system protein VirB10